MVFLIVITILLRVPAVNWGISQGDIFEPDELQHIEIAREVVHQYDRTLIEDKTYNDDWNARAFGVQIAYLFIICNKFGLSPSTTNLILIGRFLSIFYSVILVLLIYFYVIVSLKNYRAAFIAALFLSISDLNITYSHYAVPEICHVFYFYLSILFISNYLKNDRSYLNILGLGISLGMCLATKFDPSPIIAFGIAWLLYKKFSDNYRNIILVACIVIFTFAVSWNSIDLMIYYKSFRWVAAVNQNTVLKDHHYFYNPILYASAIIAGSSIFIFISGVIGFFKYYINPYACGIEGKAPLPLTLTPLILFLIYWTGDATFVRRASAFIPFFCIYSGLYLSTIRNKHLLLLVVFLIFSYTILLSIISQNAFLEDTRYKARNFIDKKYAKNFVVAYCPYSSAAVRHFNHRISMYDDRFNDLVQKRTLDFIVLHETYYGRYGKYFTTPFRIPLNCDEVYHCRSTLFNTMQSLTQNRSIYKLKYKFSAFNPFPERILFKMLYGTYETFLGDVLIYEH